MSQKYSPVRTNRTPWMDDLVLITQLKTEDADGYITVTETERTVRCTFSEGITRSEFYEGMKAGIGLSASAEIWAEDYQNEEICEIESARYKIIRVYATGRGTLELSLSEVKR